MSFQLVDDLRRRLAAAKLAARSNRDEAKSAWKTLAEEEVQHEAELRKQRLQHAQQLEDQLGQQKAVHEQQLHRGRMQHLTLMVEHEQQLHELRARHAEELQATRDAERARHATELQVAKESERALIQAAVQPVLTSLQNRQQRQEGELEATRSFVFEALEKPAASRRRLGF